MFVIVALRKNSISLMTGAGFTMGDRGAPVLHRHDYCQLEIYNFAHEVML